MLADGTLLFAGRPVTPEELRAHWPSGKREHGDDLEVRIRSDRSVEYRSIEPIMLACARAGIWNVSFAVLSSAQEADS